MASRNPPSLFDHSVDVTSHCPIGWSTHSPKYNLQMFSCRRLPNIGFRGVTFNHRFPNTRSGPPFGWNQSTETIWEKISRRINYGKVGGGGERGSPQRVHGDTPGLEEYLTVKNYFTEKLQEGRQKGKIIELKTLYPKYHR